MNKYFIICNAIWRGMDNWSYLINWSKVEVDEWESRYPNAGRVQRSTKDEIIFFTGADFQNKEDIIDLILNHSQIINRPPYLFNSLKDAKESLIRIKANDLFEDYDYTYNYYIVNFSSHLNEVIEI